MEVCEADSTTAAVAMSKEVLDASDELEPGCQSKRRRVSVEDAAKARRLREEERRHGLNWELVTRPPTVPACQEDLMMGEFEAGRACRKCEEPGYDQDQANQLIADNP